MEQSNTGRHKHSCGPSRLKRQQHDLDSEEGVTNSNQLDGSERDLLNNFDCLTTSSKASFLSSLVTSYLPSELLSPLYLSLQPLLRQDFLSRLPTEISFRILDNLDVCSLAQCLVVSKKWHTAAIADVLSWRKHYHKELWVEEEGEKENEMDKIPIAVHSSFNMQTLATSEERSNRRKQRRQDAQKQYNPYIKQLNASRKTRYMWQRGSPKSFSFHCHETSVITCLQLLDSQRVISASDDGTIRIWCLYTGHCLTSFLGHTGGVWTIHVLGSYLLSGSTDRSCRIWRLATGECLGTLTGHTSTVRCAQLFDIDDADEDRQHYYAVSGSRDNTLRIWDLRSMTEKYVLYGHLSSVRCLAVDQNRHLVVSGSYDCTARVWDLRDGSCLRVLLGHTDRIYSICLQDHLVATGGLDANVHIWDIRTGECLYILEGHRGLVGSLQFYRNTIISGNTDGTIRVWDLQTGDCRTRIRSENGATITCLQSDHQRLVAGCDKYLRLWDPKTGAFIRDLITGIDTVWRVVFDDNVCVAACQTEGLTTIYVFRFDG